MGSKKTVMQPYSDLMAEFGDVYSEYGTTARSAKFTNIFETTKLIACIEEKHDIITTLDSFPLTLLNELEDETMIHIIRHERDILEHIFKKCVDLYTSTEHSIVGNMLIKYGRTEDIENYIEKREDLHNTCKCDLLLLAIENCEGHIIQHIIKKMKITDVASYNGKNLPLYSLVHSKHDSVLKYFIDEHSAHKLEPNGIPFIVLCYDAGKKDIVKYILQKPDTEFDFTVYGLLKHEYDMDTLLRKNPIANSYAISILKQYDFDSMMCGFATYTYVRPR